MAGDARLSLSARQIVGDPSSDLLFSVASLWEIAIKHSIGKLPLARRFEDLFPAQLTRDRIGLLAVEPRYLAALVGLPHHHRDPFDRLIVSTAIVEGVPVLTADPAFSAYPVVSVPA